MVQRALTWQDAMFAVIVIAVGIVAATAVRLLVRRYRGRLRFQLANKDLVVNTLRDLATWVLVVTGVWIGVARLPLTGPVSRWTYRVLAAILVLCVAVAVSRLVGGLVSTVLTRTGVASSASIFVNIAKLATLAVGMLIVLQTVGISVTPLLTAMGVGGIAVALALQDTLANLFSGVHLLASRKLQPGNYIQLDTHEGYVVDINWRNTTMRDLMDNMVIVPNAMLSNGAVVNCDQPTKTQLVVVQARVAYDSDLSHVERAAASVGRRVLSDVEGGDSSFDPVVRFHTFGDTSIDFSVILQVDEFGDQYLVKHELIKRLHERFRTENITMIP